MTSRIIRRCGASALGVLVAALATISTGEELVTKTSVEASKKPGSESATIPDTDPAKGPSKGGEGEESETAVHPLAWTIEYAATHSDYIRNHVHDYTCRLIKRERIEGKLQDYQFMQAQVRCERREDDEVVQPLAVFMRFMAPARFKDRRILYVEGENEGKMLVRKGGIGRFKYVKLKIDPAGTAAKRESNYPITDIGFDRIMDRLVQLVKDDIKNDPTAANTQVSRMHDAKVNGRVCTHIAIVHPNQSEGILFHKASLYVDDELNVPIRLVVYDWPKAEGEKSPLIEEYTYVDLQLNVGLTDADFSTEKLGSTPKRHSTEQASLAR